MGLAGASMACRILAKFCQDAHSCGMSTMNISLPDTLKSFVDGQVAEQGYSTSSEYVRELFRADQDRRHLRGLLLQGAASAPGPVADPAYFDALRQRICKGTAPSAKA